MDSFYQNLAQWYQTPLGRYLAQTERQQTQPMLPQLDRARILQIGQLGTEKLWPLEQKMNKFYQIQLTPIAHNPLSTHHNLLLAQAEALPFYAHQFKLCIAPHVLEFTAQPQQVLREINRVLCDDGHLLLSGFNPLSLWGLRRCFTSDMPFCGRFRSFFRLKDWLNLLTFEIISIRYAAFNLPLQANPLYSDWLDNAGQKWQWQSGGVYIILAQKRRYPMNLISELSYRAIMVHS
jgi:SAM-dependent methyltransferase